MERNSDTQAATNRLPGNQISTQRSLASGPLKGVSICVVGGGFVGLVVAAGFAEFGHDVVCVEKDADRLAQLQTGKIPFYERDLEGLLAKNLEAGRLSFASDLAQAVSGQTAIFVAVGTPSLHDGRSDLTALEDVAAVLAQSLQGGQIVVLKSTVPVGSGDRIQEILATGMKNGGSVAVVNNPEFLREGSAVYDFFNPQRIVLGGDSPDAVEAIAHIYRLGMAKPVPIVTTNARTAEMIKYASNAFLTTKVGFVNELAGLCDQTGIDVLDVARGMGMDPRIGPEFLDPGPGWGGSCFRKDMMELSGLAAASGFPLMITEAVLASNQRQHELVANKIEKLTGHLRGARVGVLGLSFKAGTSDMRDSAAIPIIHHLTEAGAIVTAFDPQAHVEADRWLPSITLAEDAYGVAADADCVAILTEWREFQLLDWKTMAQSMRRPNLVDARNLLTPEQAHRCGLNYASMGQA